MRRTLTLISIILLASGALMAQGHHRQEGSRQGSIMERHDLNGDGQITYEEFAESFKEHFDNMDQNGDGVITEVDVKALHEERLAGRSQRMASHIGGMFAYHADSDGSGDVTQEEWTTFVNGLETDENGTVDLSSIARRPMGTPRGDRAARHLVMLDRNENGQVDIEDLNLLFTELDADGSGALEQGELGSRGHGRGKHRGH